MTASFEELLDLASERLGGAAIEANDEFFAFKDNLVKGSQPEWREGEYTDRGKWMDGWETRRRRDVTPDAHDWCVIRLGVSGIVRGVDVETTHFSGNYPESCALDALQEAQGSTVDRWLWTEILPRTPLRGDSHNLLPIVSASNATHLRLRIYPDGGVARFRAFGEAAPDWDRLRAQGDVDLAAAEHGGLVVACSDMFYGSRHNLIMPGEATHMGDGWETKRRRGPGHDWTVIRLGTKGQIRRVDVDTRHFKGNAPGSCSLEAVQVDGLDNLALRESLATLAWTELLPRTALQPHARHLFEDELRPTGAATHVRFNIFPDGGVGRLRLFGRPA